MNEQIKRRLRYFLNLVNDMVSSGRGDLNEAYYNRGKIVGMLSVLNILSEEKSHNLEYDKEAKKYTIEESDKDLMSEIDS